METITAILTQSAGLLSGCMDALSAFAADLIMNLAVASALVSTAPLQARSLKGAKIGDEAIIAAGAIITKDIPAHCIAAGVSAKVIRNDISWK
jgi:hypothetical protein